MADLQSLRGGQAAAAGFVDPLPIVRHPGVRYRPEGTLDFYTGKAADLIAAGLAAAHELPGAPGMPRAVVQLTPEGTHRRGKVRDLPRGSRIIERFGERYRVRLVLGGWRRPEPAAACARAWPFSDELWRCLQGLDHDALRRAENQIRALLDMEPLSQRRPGLRLIVGGGADVVGPRRRPALRLEHPA